MPQPEVEASETNPRGFYEPQWVIDFHKRHLKELALFNIDSRPAAVDLVADYVASGDADRRAARVALRPARSPSAATRSSSRTRTPSGSPRSGRQVSAELGADLRWLTALRHPAEVVGSRDIAYLSSQSDDLRLTKETSNVAGWVHAALLTEQAGRGHKRSFVRYADLLADWRAALAPVQQQLELDFDTDLAAPASERAHHAVDDFIEPSMRKSQLTWDDVRTPDWLREMAEEVWQLLGVLTTSPQDAETLRARSTGSTTTTTPATPTPSPSPSTTPRPRRPSPGARRATPSAAPSSSCAATSRRHAPRRCPDVGGREAAAILRRAVVRRVRRG